tara:strand:- start:211 stop:354 length:144 start_codon:yes stop_codon:yes gene_type:complete
LSFYCLTVVVKFFKIGTAHEGKMKTQLRVGAVPEVCRLERESKLIDL